ncbi:MAG: DUF4184 family protein [Sarcina sp.]
MPFTFAHAAIVLPANKYKSSWISFTALIIGSMLPDFEYFIRFAPYGVIGHTFLGFLYFNVPLAIIIAFAWHNIIKEPFIKSMPQLVVSSFGESIYEKFKIRNLKSGIVFIYSAIIGMATHVIWDGFTHKTGMFVNNIEFLRRTVEINGYFIPVYKFIQHGSTLIGGIFIIFCLYKWRVKKYIDNNPYSLKRKLIYWINVSILTLIIYGIRIFLTLQGVTLKSYGILIVSLISSFILAVFFISLLYKKPLKLKLYIYYL